MGDSDGIRSPFQYCSKSPVRGFIALADTGNDIPASDLSGLQSFVRSTYYALTVH